MFLDDIRPLLICGHDRFNVFDSRYVKCETCNHTIDAYEVILNFPDNNNNPFLSSYLAHSFASWTGNIHVPCSFLINIDNVLPKRIVTKLSTLLRGIDLLKALNKPFDKNNNDKNDDKKHFKNLMIDFVSLIDKTCCSGDTDILALKAILTNMKNVFENVDLFDQYYDIFVPYLKSLDESFYIHTNNNDNPPGYVLYEEIEKSNSIRRNYSKYCIPFDVAHIMVFCYLCGDDIDTVWNLIGDLMSRVCQKYFDHLPITSSTHHSVYKYLDQINNRKKRFEDLYHHLRKYFNEEEIIECFSDEFVKTYGLLEQSVKKEIRLDENNKLDSFTYQQTFPYILFAGKDEDYYGFLIALTYYISKSSNIVPKGTISECKKLYRFVKNCILRIRLFDNNKQQKMYWTRDVINLFLCSDEIFKNEMDNMLKMIIATNK